MENNILHETVNLYLYRMSNGNMEIRLNGITHAVVVGKVKDLERGKVTMERLERYPKQLREFMAHR